MSDYGTDGYNETAAETLGAAEISQAALMPVSGKIMPMIESVNRALRASVYLITNALSANSAYCFSQKKPCVPLAFVHDNQLTLS